MNIYIGFKKNNENVKKSNLNGTIYNYSDIYCENEKSVEIFSNKKLSEKELEYLGKIYFNDKKIFEKGYIDLVIDKYIINFIEN